MHEIYVFLPSTPSRMHGIRDMHWTVKDRNLVDVVFHIIMQVFF